MKGKIIANIEIGDFAEHAKSVSGGYAYLFAGITCYNHNPAHINAQNATPKGMNCSLHA